MGGGIFVALWVLGLGVVPPVASRAGTGSASNVRTGTGRAPN